MMDRVRIISAILFLNFLSFALLQWNDPDPLYWGAIYLAIATVSLLGVINKQNKNVVVGVGLIITAISFLYLPGFIEWISLPEKGEIFGEMVYQKPYIEETREFIGLLMGLASLIYQYLKS
ncbi:MAG: transmembrane 220 family protein [Cyclobacteriaceae bacterium]|nr:transmembrane 220 family protein [Cyclobacteriaceae bacterium]